MIDILTVKRRRRRVNGNFGIERDMREDGANGISAIKADIKMEILLLRKWRCTKRNWVNQRNMSLNICSFSNKVQDRNEIYSVKEMIYAKYNFGD